MSSLEHHLIYTAPVNEAVGGPIKAIFQSLGIEDPHIFGDLLLWHNPTYPLTDQILQTWVIMGLVVGGLAVYSGRIRKVPVGFQNILEIAVIGFRDALVGLTGKHGAKHITFMLSIGLYIFLGNLIGIVPFNMSPTSNLNVTISCAILSFLYYNYHGVRENGVKNYIAHFFGPPLPFMLKPVNLLMFPIELISHLARPLSLSLRLFGNIMGEDLVLIILASLIPLFVPLPMMLFMVFTSFLQAFVFVFLSMLYLAGAVHHEHGDDHDGHGHDHAHAH